LSNLLIVFKVVVPPKHLQHPKLVDKQHLCDWNYISHLVKCFFCTTPHFVGCTLHAKHPVISHHIYATTIFIGLLSFFKAPMSLCTTINVFEQMVLHVTLATINMKLIHVHLIIILVHVTHNSRTITTWLTNKTNSPLCIISLTSKI